MNPDTQTGHHPEQHGVSSQAGLASLRGVGGETVTEPARTPDCATCGWRWHGDRTKVDQAIALHVRITQHEAVDQATAVGHAVKALREAGAGLNSTYAEDALTVFESIDLDALADEIPRVTVGSGYYSATIGYDEAREIAEAVKAWLTGAGA